MLCWRSCSYWNRRALEVAQYLEVVPQTGAELFFEDVEELVLFRCAIEVLEAESQQMARLTAPLPTGLSDERTTVIEFLPQMPIHREERSPAHPRLASGAVV